MWDPGQAAIRSGVPSATMRPPATAAKWTYKAIFRIGDQRVGQWSDEVSIIIGG